MDRYETKEIGRLRVSTQFFGHQFGHASVREEGSDEALRLDAEQLHDLHYALGRIIARIEEGAKRNG